MNLLWVGMGVLILLGPLTEQDGRKGRMLLLEREGGFRTSEEASSKKEGFCLLRAQGSLWSTF
jgi:hypothetical protein